MVLTVNSDYFLNRINQLIFELFKYGVLFEVRTEFLNIMYTSFGVKVLMFNYSILFVVNRDVFSNTTSLCQNICCLR
jgi:hypothetical protein